jgi:pimeloyl-ACP methyl ester carboxylesterase
LLLLAYIAFIGSRATLSPPRRTVEKWQRDWLADPASHGITLTSFTSSNGTPCLICEPSAKPLGKKSLDLRKELQTRGTSVPAWGEIRGTILLLHGHKGCKEDHLPISERFCAAGFRCLCVDLPGHGQHPAPYATFGHTEMNLLAGVWQDFLTTHPDATQPLLLFGVSQGAAIALQGAANPQWPVRAVASVCSFASLDQPIAASADHLPSLIHGLKPLTTRACAMGIYCRSGFFPHDISPLAAAPRIDCPVFLCHGKEDRFIPVSASEQLFAAVSHEHKTLRIIPKASHHNVLATGSTELYADICEFFLRSL